MFDVNSKGPNLDSCGTPDSAHLDDDVLSPIITLCERPHKYDYVNHCRAVPEKV